MTFMEIGFFQFHSLSCAGGSIEEMQDDNKTKEQVIKELAEMRQRVGELETLEADYRRKAKILQPMVEGTYTATGGSFFHSLVRSLAVALQVRYAFITECLDLTATRVRTLAFWMGEELDFAENFEYDLTGTACHKVIGGEICYYPEGVQKLFPGDKILSSLEAESYMGIPIVASSGKVIGHLAALDSKPMTDECCEASVLKIFSARAASEMERKQSEDECQRLLEQLRVKHKFLETVAQQIPVGVIIAEAPSGSLIFSNKYVQEIWRHPSLPANKVEYYAMYKGFHNDGRPYIPEEWPLSRSIMVGEVVADEEINFLRGDSTQGIKNTSSAPVRGNNESITAGVVTFYDITERKNAEEEVKKALKEKEALLKEIHHRVKNNLQITSSLLSLQSRHVKGKKTREKFKESRNRIHSMALIHEMLYSSGDFVEVSFGDYIKSLTVYLFNSYGASSRVKLSISTERASLSIDKAIPCGLIINEIVSNSLKHAFAEEREGEIRITFSADVDNYTLVIWNNGIPFPKNVDFRNTKSLGLQLVCALVEQLKGTIELDSSKGTEFKITFSGGE